jgi:hypothetical protein
VYASAIPWKTVLPGSPVVMCHHSIVTGSPAAAEADAGGATLGSGATLAAVLGAAALGWGLALVPQALAMIATAPIAPAIRFRDDTTTSSR